ncbi:hypothetical protein ACUR5C_03530 [Aliikangiella sp. IMCC44653]
MSKKNQSQINSRIGNLLLSKGWVSQAELEQALAYQVEHSSRLGESLVALGFISQKQLSKVLTKQKHIRRVIAGLVMLSAPLCPALASDKSNKLFNSNQMNHLDGQHLNANNDDLFKISNRFKISKPKSKEVFLELATGNNKRDTPQLGQYFSSISLSSSFTKPTQFTEQDRRADRYKNTSPSVYRLTLKGYSVIEKDDKKISYWNLNKMKNSPYKKYEVMFSVTKHF